MQASIFEISIFPLVFQIPVSRRVHIGRVRARIRAEYRKRFVGGEREGRGREEGGGRGGGRKRNVRASRHRRTLRLHPIPRFYSLIPLCSPPGSQGDFYSSLRISTLTSRHPQPSPFPLRAHLTPSHIRSLSLSLLPRLLKLPSGSSPGRRSNTLSQAPFARHPFHPLRHPLRDSLEST